VPLGTRVAQLLRAAFAALATLMRGVAAGLRRVNPRAVLLAALIAAIVVAGAFGLSALFGGGTSKAGGPTSASLRAADALLGVQLSTPPNGGVVIATETRGGPAELAGLDPGDLMTGIDNRPVDGSGDVASALSGLHEGDQVAIQVSRGSAIITTLVTLTNP
jgi:membrane-associated protease RseP (regulator of RpoE activity)